MKHRFQELTDPRSIATMSFMVRSFLGCEGCGKRYWNHVPDRGMLPVPGMIEIHGNLHLSISGVWCRECYAKSSS